LTITNSTVSRNTTGFGGEGGDGGLNPGGVGGDGGDGRDGGLGGGIYNQGESTLTNSTVSSNTTGYGGDGGMPGGGNSLGDWGDGGEGGHGGGHGGGIFSLVDPLTLNNCTVSENRTGTGGLGLVAGLAGSGGGILNREGSVNGRNTIIADNTAPGDSPDFDGTLTSYGCNLVEDT